MSDDGRPNFVNTGPELHPEVRWLGWLLLAAVAVLALVVLLGLRGTASTEATLPSDDLGATGAPVDGAAPSVAVTLSCVAPGRGTTSLSAPEVGNAKDYDVVSGGDAYPVSSTTDLAVGHACDQLRQRRVTHALELGLFDVVLLTAGVGLSLVRPRRLPDPAPPHPA